MIGTSSRCDEGDEDETWAMRDVCTIVAPEGSLTVKGEEC